VSLELSRLDYGNATLAGIPMYQLKRLQSVLNAAARLVFSSPRRDHVSPLLSQLYWLKAPERIQYKLAVLVYKCLNGMAPSYLADEFLQPADLTTRTRLRSASSLFNSPYTVVDGRRPSVSGRCCPCSEQSAASCHLSSIAVCLLYSRLKSYLFKQSFP